MLFFIKITPVIFDFFWRVFHVFSKNLTRFSHCLAILKGGWISHRLKHLGTPLKLAFANNEQPIIRPYRLCCSRSHLYSRWNREIDDDEPVSKQKTGNRYSIEKKPAASHDNSRSIKGTNHGKGKQKKYITERKVTRRGAGNAIPRSLKAMAFLTWKLIDHFLQNGICKRRFAATCTPNN